MRTSLCRRGQYLLSTLAVLIMLAPESARSQVPLAPNTQVPLSPKAIKKFVQPLPLLDVQGGPIATTAATNLAVTMCEFPTNILPLGTIAPGVQTSTWTWGYSIAGACPTAPQQTYIGPVVIARRNVPTEITWINNLGTAATTNVLAYKFSTDPTLHWADPYGLDCMTQTAATMGIPAYNTPCSWNYDGPIPAVPHLHGGEVPPGIDGSPDSWFTSDGLIKGHKYYTKAGGAAPANGATYAYPNTQEAGPLWFHDHTLGATRLNVYAGLAGAYFLTDPDLALPPNLQGVGEVIPLVIQDRMFDTTGQLFFPAATWGGVVNALNPEHPYWIPEFIGDTIVVNGKAWPFVNVAAEALPLPLPERLQRAHLRALPREPRHRHAWPRPERDRHRRRLPRLAAGGRSGARRQARDHARRAVRGDHRLRRPSRTPGCSCGTPAVRPTPAAPRPAAARSARSCSSASARPRSSRTRSYDPALGGAIRGAGQAITRLVNPLTGTLHRGPHEDPAADAQRGHGDADDRLRRRHRRADRLPGRAAGDPRQQHQVDRRPLDGRDADDAPGLHADHVGWTDHLVLRAAERG